MNHDLSLSEIKQVMKEGDATCTSTKIESLRTSSGESTFNPKGSPVQQEEVEIESLWHDQRGIDPRTGKMWLTPRMEREASALQKHWDSEASPVSSGESSRGIGVSPSKTECVITPRVPQEPTVEEETEYENLASWWMKRKELEAYD